MFGATLASSLASLAFSGALDHAASRHLVLADRRVMGMSLIHNLMHMPSLQTHVASDTVQTHVSNSTRITYHAALVAPDHLRSSQLPSLIIEDDIWLVDGFGARMLDVVRSAERQAQGQPFFISFYRPEWSSGNPLDIRAKHQKEFPPQAAAAAAKAPYVAEKRPYSSCTQALYFSSGALRRQLAQYYQHHILTSPDRPLQDIPIHEFLNKAGILQFYPDKSLVQHTGASSAIFGGGTSNKRFHRAVDFPFVEKYVVEDGAPDWWVECRAGGAPGRSSVW
jgi:hypothetical protein